MVFTTPIFLFLFFPISIFWYLLIYRMERIHNLVYLRKFRISDCILIAFSLCFYGWACFDNIYKLCCYILIIYFLALFRRGGTQVQCMLSEDSVSDGDQHGTLLLGKAKVFYIIGLLLVLLALFYYKYFNFTIDNLNSLLGLGIKDRTILAPLGISFITFSAISYLTDVYTGRAKPGSLIDCALYITFFPKVVSGPIVLWRYFASGLPQRTINIDNCLAGINRIIIGFAKKLILADMFGLYIHKIETSGAYGIDSATAWLSALLYMLQIYYDFAGYSDIAIGLAKVTGFDFKENFNFPYRSRSISEFWRRWHISLGTWFKEYVYIPLGGSRIGKGRTLLNLAIVFALTGIWHGANWTYILWGSINGVMVILERVVEYKKFYQKTPDMLKWLFSMFVTLICWELFRFQHIQDFWNWVLIAVGYVTYPSVNFTWEYFLDLRLSVLVIIGILGATALGRDSVQELLCKNNNAKGYLVLKETLLLTLFFISILCMVNSTYSPFIYFQY